MRVTATGVTVAIEKTPIVSAVDIDVPAGAFVGLLGPNGSGKSTLLRAIYRALRPVAGAIYLDDDEVWRLTARQSAQRTAVVAQETPSDFDFTTREIVAMGRTPHKRLLERDSRQDEAIIADALARVGMAEKSERVYATLSGGEKQRVLVARALAQQSRVLILDEPTNHLDIRAQLELLELVRDLGVTVLAALHDLNLAAAYCDRLYLLDHGAIVASGPPAEVLTPACIETVFGVRVACLAHPATGRLALLFSSRAPHGGIPG